MKSPMTRMPRSLSMPMASMLTATELRLFNRVSPASLISSNPMTDRRQPGLFP